MIIITSKAITHLKAFIDFAKDEHITELYPSIPSNLTGLSTEIQLHLSDSQRGEIARKCTNVYVLGKQNAGKGSFFNA